MENPRVTEVSAPATTRYWIGVVSRAHVQGGVAGGFAQLCHGKERPLRRMRSRDWLISYSPRTEPEGGAPIHSFTAIGRLSFIKDKARWGFRFRTGHFEIGAADFELIAEAMGVDPRVAERESGA